jgi:hypothetical protein
MNLDTEAKNNRIERPIEIRNPANFVGFFVFLFKRVIPID